MDLLVPDIRSTPFVFYRKLRHRDRIRFLRTGPRTDPGERIFRTGLVPRLASAESHPSHATQAPTLARSVILGGSIR